MSVRSARIAIFVTGLLLIAGSARAQDLPDGKEKDLVVKACNECHSSERIISSHRTVEDWRDVV